MIRSALVEEEKVLFLALPLQRNWEEGMKIQSAAVCLAVGLIPGRNLCERNTFGGAQKTELWFIKFVC